MAVRSVGSDGRFARAMENQTMQYFARTERSGQLSSAYPRPSILSRKAVHHGPARHRTPILFFEPMSKRRKGFPSEAKVKRGVRIVHGDKEFAEKLGRNDLCPCGSGKRFKRCCLRSGRF